MDIQVMLSCDSLLSTIYIYNYQYFDDVDSKGCFRKDTPCFPQCIYFQCFFFCFFVFFLATFSYVGQLVMKHIRTHPNLESETIIP